MNAVRSPIQKSTLTGGLVAVGATVFGVVVSSGAVAYALLAAIPWLLGAAVLTIRGRKPSDAAAAPAGVADELARALVKLADAVVVANAEGVIVRFSPVAEHLTGWSAQAAIGRPLREVCVLRRSGESGDVPPLARAHTLRSTWSSERPTELVDRAGDSRPVAYVLSPFQTDDGERRVLMVFRDVTQQVRVESTLRRTEGDYRRLIELSPDGIVVLGDNQVVYANPAFVAMLGFPTMEELIGHNLRDRVAAGDAAAWDTLQLEAPIDEQAMRVRVQNRDGGYAVLEIAPAKQMHWDGASATLLLARDVTESCELQEMLTQADRMASLGTLAAGVAHEINNPLSYILVNMEILAEDIRSVTPALMSRDGEPLADLISETLDGVSSICQIVGDLSTYARLPDSVRAGPADVEKVLRSVVTLTASEHRDVARCRMEFANVPPVRADEGRLGQVVLNLVLNALYAVREQEDEDSVITLRTREDVNGDVVIEIQDTGSGISRADQERIFDPFFTTKPVGEGTGLGLAVSHRIVVELGGALSVTSEPGKGACFRIVLPGYVKTGDLPRAPGPRRPEAQAKKRILIADDDRRVAQSVARTLRAYRTEVVTTGAAALSRARSDDYDVIICDVMMPGLNGVEVYERLIAERPELAERFVFLTGGVISPDAEEFRDLMTTRFLQKPIGRNELLDAIEAVTNRKPRDEGAWRPESDSAAGAGEKRLDRGRRTS